MKQFLKHIIDNVFNIYGLEIRKKIRKKDRRRTTLAEVLNHVSKLGFRPQKVVDVGAACGTFELYKKFPEANHFLIEPLEEFEKDLQNISHTGQNM